MLANERTSMDFSNPYFHQKYLKELNRIMDKTSKNELDKMEMSESLMISDDEDTVDEKGRKHCMIPALNVDDNSVVGFVDIETRDSSSLPSPYVSDCVVSKSYRRCGVGSALIAAAEEKAMQWGENELYHYVNTENKGAVEFYRRCGFFPIKGEVGPLDEPYVSESINQLGNAKNSDDSICMNDNDNDNDEENEGVVVDGTKILPTATWNLLGSLYERILLKKFVQQNGN